MEQGNDGASCRYLVWNFPKKKKKEMMWLAYTAEFVEQKRLDVPITLHKRFDVMR